MFSIEWQPFFKKKEGILSLKLTRRRGNKQLAVEYVTVRMGNLPPTLGTST